MYKLDPTLASKADSIGAYLNETGKYTGIFTRAEKLVSQTKGTHGIGFTFKAEDGRECRFDVWTKKGNDEPLQGLNQINAMMACLMRRELPDSQQNIKKWENGQEVIVSAPCFTGLMNTRIGLLLRSEEYEKMQQNQPTGEYGWRMNLFAVFQADTELMASEIMKRKTTPEQLDKVIMMLADKPLKKQNATARQNVRGAGGQYPADIDGDIPFRQYMHGRICLAM